MNPGANTAMHVSPQLTATGASRVGAESRARAWYVFALCFSLMLLDYMARQVVVAMFPVFKAQWSLTDTKLGALASIVSLAVSVLSVPLAVVADRYSRVKAIAVMALVWSAATAAGAFATTYEHLLIARFFVGAGEAAYGAAAASLIASVFPVQQRSAAIGSFMAASPFGSMLGTVIGGAVGGGRFGWQAGLWMVGLPGIVLAGLFLFLRDYQTVDLSVTSRDGGKRRVTFLEGAAEMFRSRSILAAYAANALLIFVAGTMLAWIPSFFNRVWGLSMAAASVRAGGVILAAGVGSGLCGFIVDRLSRGGPRALFLGPAGIALGVTLLLGGAFRLAPGPLQYLLLVMGAIGLAGTQGPMLTVIASLVHPGLRATAFAVLAVVQNLLGLAAGALLTGFLSDRLGLLGALSVVPLAALGSAVLFVLGSRAYVRELAAKAAAQA
jgi:predicted MFS family arabinose efflux permease